MTHESGRTFTVAPLFDYANIGLAFCGGGSAGHVKPPSAKTVFSRVSIVVYRYLFIDALTWCLCEK
jgi:hypothetical protein